MAVRTGRFEAEPEIMAEINVTPLVDVVLVLLLIFMVTAPLLSAVIEVDVPEVTADAPRETGTLVIHLGREGAIAVGEAVVTLEEAVQAARLARREDGEHAVFLRADREVPYGLVMSVLDRLNSAGVEDVSLVVQPLADEEGEASRAGDRP